MTLETRTTTAPSKPAAATFSFMAAGSLGRGPGTSEYDGSAEPPFLRISAVSPSSIERRVACSLVKPMTTTLETGAAAGSGLRHDDLSFGAAISTAPATTTTHTTAIHFASHTPRPPRVMNLTPRGENTASQT